MNYYLSIPIKTTADFNYRTGITKLIQSKYSENPSHFDNDITSLQTLRSHATLSSSINASRGTPALASPSSSGIMSPTTPMSYAEYTAEDVLKYYSQLEHLQTRFPFGDETVFGSFDWHDAFSVSNQDLTIGR